MEHLFHFTNKGRGLHANLFIHCLLLLKAASTQHVVFIDVYFIAKKKEDTNTFFLFRYDLPPVCNFFSVLG